jgi:hypothetical protein
MIELHPRENANGRRGMLVTFSREDIEAALATAARKAVGDESLTVFTVSIDGQNTFELNGTVILKGE